MSTSDSGLNYIAAGLEQRVKRLEQQVIAPLFMHHELSNLMAFQLATFRHTNRILERRCFETTQRGQHLASDLGFEDVDEAETALSTNPHLYHRASIEYNATRVTELERDLRKQTELLKDDLHSTQELTQTVNRLCAENSRLRDEVERAKIGLFFPS